jgi:hypothetical protein
VCNRVRIPDWRRTRVPCARLKDRWITAGVRKSSSNAVYSVPLRQVRDDGMAAGHQCEPPVNLSADARRLLRVAACTWHEDRIAVCIEYDNAVWSLRGLLKELISTRAERVA